MARISKAKLIQLQKRLKTDDKIGKQYGITRQAVHQLRKKYGIDSVIAKNAERNQKIVEAYKAGKPGTALAKKFGLSISQAYRIIGEGKKARKKVKKGPGKKTNPKAIGTWPTPERPTRKAPKRKAAKKKVVKKKVVKKTKMKVSKKKK